MKFKKFINENKFDKILKNEKDLIKKYNDKNFLYGWLQKHSNAKIHIKNREKAEKLFGTKKSDLLGL